AENCPSAQNLMLREGIAELISYLYGQNFGFKYSKKISEGNLYPRYRLGLEKSMNLKRKMGLRKLLQRVKVAKNFKDISGAFARLKTQLAQFFSCICRSLCQPINF
ncbi:hypothetical protein ACFL35_21260, partial [Candidatus Riflebacteria bacterium]